jgi:threonylcarbamoyladenosine tRNA methylthiotransferase MtaB
VIKIASSTLGCKVNQYESAGILEALDKNLFCAVPFNTVADCYIINTCTVTSQADYQSRQLIRRAIRTNPDALIIVTGCYAQTAPSDIAGIPGVDLILGTAEKDSIPALIRNLTKDKPQTIVNDVDDIGMFSKLFPKRFPGRSRAFLKIQDGCSSYCSYCIVPYARGRSRSLSENEVINRIAAIAREGYREIVLTGIHLGMYGYDLQPASGLINILESVERSEIVERLRLSSLEVTEISDDMIGLMANSRILCRHLHIPLQSGDDGILAAMKRNYTSAFFKNRIKEIADAIPDISIGIDVMVGFPGEDEKAFSNTLHFIKELPVAYLHVFPYSKRPGTPASNYAGHIKENDKKARVKILRELGEMKRHSFAKTLQGKHLTVLVEGKKDPTTGMMKGYSDNYVPVLIPDDDPDLHHRIVRVIAEDARGGTLSGRITDL